MIPALADCACHLLQAFAQVPDLHVWYGPDTYMGRNLALLLQSLSRGTDDEVLPLSDVELDSKRMALLRQSLLRGADEEVLPLLNFRSYSKIQALLLKSLSRGTDEEVPP